jgi:hypothetical protein
MNAVQFIFSFHTHQMDLIVKLCTLGPLFQVRLNPERGKVKWSYNDSVSALASWQVNSTHARKARKYSGKWLIK